MSDPLVDLIDRLREATAGSESLDFEIIVFLGQSAGYEEDGNYGPYRILPRRQRYTRSVDAAMTLVQKGWYWEIASRSEYDPRPNARLCYGRHDIEVDAATPALALCIAALEARRKEKPDAE